MKILRDSNKKNKQLNDNVIVTRIAVIWSEIADFGSSASNEARHDSICSFLGYNDSYDTLYITAIDDTSQPKVSFCQILVHIGDQMKCVFFRMLLALSTVSVHMQRPFDAARLGPQRRKRLQRALIRALLAVERQDLATQPSTQMY